jgi:hypothetical protein
MRSQKKADLIAELQGLLHDVFVARIKGESHPRLSRAQGYVDGYMRVLLETQLADKKELLAIVAEERAGVDGPATRTIHVEHVSGDELRPSVDSDASQSDEAIAAA